MKKRTAIKFKPLETRLNGQYFVSAEGAGGLALLKSQVKGNWLVVHVRSGKVVWDILWKKSLCRTFIRRLLTLGDWTRTAKELRADKALQIRTRETLTQLIKEEREKIMAKKEVKRHDG